MNLRKRQAFIMILLIFVILAAGCQKANPGANNGDVIANVDNHVISKDTYNKHLSLFKKNYEDMYGDKVWSLDVGGKTFLQAVQENVLEKLITDIAIVEYLQSKNVEVSQDEIDEQYAGYMERMKDQTEVKKFFDENGIDEAFIKQQIKTDLYMNKFYTMVIDDLDLSEEKLKEYYEQNKEDYRDIKVKASHILVEKEEEAKSILQKLSGGEDFAKLAEEFSQDPGSATQGGDLGYFAKGMMVPEFDEAAFSLKPGEISEPIKTKFGYHIIKVFDKVDQMEEFEVVKEDIKATITDNALVDKSEEIKNSFKIEKYPERIK